MKYKKILICGNCITYGLKNSFTQLNHQLQVDGLTTGEIKQLSLDSLKELNQYDLIITLKFQSLTQKFDEANIDKSKLFFYTDIGFGGFHPDSFHLNHQGKNLAIPNRFGFYHSKIIFACFKNGIPIEQIKEFFTSEKVFQSCNYYDYWAIAKERIIHKVNSFGFNGNELFSIWTSNQNIFMHSPNHPKVEVLFEYAKHILHKLNIPIEIETPLLEDNLLNAIVLPTFPLIADYLGLKGGSTFFKRVNTIQLSTLDDYINACFELYRSLNFEDITIPENTKPHFEQVSSILQRLVK